MSDNHHPLSPVDASWLRMDEPSNPMVISALLTLKSPLSIEQLRKIAERHWMQFERFGMHLQKTGRKWAWEIDQNFCVTNHVNTFPLKQSSERADLEAFCSQQMEASFAPEHPAWALDLVPDYKGGSAVLIRMQHCLADGITMIGVLFSITRPKRWDPTTEKQRPAVSAASPPIRSPRGTFGSVLKLATVSKDGKTDLKGPLNGRKFAAWTDALPLTELKALGKKQGATLNDTVVNLFAGSLQRHLSPSSKQRSTPARKMIRAVVPVDLREKGDAQFMGNKFGLVFVDLPLDINDPGERLKVIQERMTALKNSSQAWAILRLMDVVGRLPHWVHNRLVSLLSSKASVIMTNVRGPAEPMYMADSEVNRVQVWVPQAGRLGLGLSIFSYQDSVYIGVAGDRARVPDPQPILDGIQAEFQALRSALES